jgi:hypothetical protein
MLDFALSLRYQFAIVLARTVKTYWRDTVRKLAWIHSRGQALQVHIQNANYSRVQILVFIALLFGTIYYQVGVTNTGVAGVEVRITLRPEHN